MALYYRYQKLQKYKNGKPVEPPEYREGQFMGSGEWDYIEECENGNFEWVKVEDKYICKEIEGHFYRLSVLQKYINGVPTDPPVFKEGDIISESFDTIEDCESGITWELVDGYLCDSIEDEVIEEKLKLIKQYKDFMVVIDSGSSYGYKTYSSLRGLHTDFKTDGILEYKPVATYQNPEGVSNITKSNSNFNPYLFDPDVLNNFIKFYDSLGKLKFVNSEFFNIDTTLLPYLTLDTFDLESFYSLSITDVYSCPKLTLKEYTHPISLGFYNMETIFREKKDINIDYGKFNPIGNVNFYFNVTQQINHNIYFDISSMEVHENQTITLSYTNNSKLDLKLNIKCKESVKDKIIASTGYNYNKFSDKIIWQTII